MVAAVVVAIRKGRGGEPIATRRYNANMEAIHDAHLCCDVYVHTGTRVPPYACPKHGTTPQRHKEERCGDDSGDFIPCTLLTRRTESAEREDECSNIPSTFWRVRRVWKCYCFGEYGEEESPVQSLIAWQINLPVLW